MMRRPHVLRTAVPLAGLALVVAMLGVTGPSGRADAASTELVRNPTFARDVSGWKPTANAALTRVTWSSGAAGAQLRPRSRAGSKTVSMTSTASPATIALAGSTVTVTARLRSSEINRRVSLEILEHDGSTLVSQRAATRVVRTTDWAVLTVNLVTTHPGTRIRVRAGATNLTGRHYVWTRSVAATMTPPAQQGCEDIDYSDPAQGALTFEDGFDGTRPDGTGLDQTRWRVRDRTSVRFDQAWISKDNVSVHDGVLDIMGKKMAVPRTGVPHLYEWNTVRDYTTGYVDGIDGTEFGNPAADRFSQRYGYFEIRAKLPSEATMSRGVWPAFWLRADHAAGEIDPMEAYGAPTTRGFDPSPSYEWNSWEDTSQVSSTAHTHGRAHPKLDNVPVWQGWHTYGVNWSPTCLRYTYDGTTVGLVPLSSKPYFTGPTFDDTFHIRLNMHIGSNYWGKADDAYTRPEFHYLIDSVKVWQAKALLPAR